MTDHLVTERLTLIPITFEIADAALNDRKRLQSLIGARVADEWPNPDFTEALPFIRADSRKNAAFAKWSRAIVHTADNIVIGDSGFKSLPDKTGSVEIGYGIVPAYRNRGFALEAASALVDWAFRHAEVRQITAECLEDNEASKRVLEKLGMQFTETQSSNQGPLLKWRLVRST
jgi:[ribosomal protein S5]-alanine N-acetyltransferase